MEQSFSPSNITESSSPYPDPQQSPPPQLIMPPAAPTTPGLRFKLLTERARVDKHDIHAVILDFLILHGYNRTATKFAMEAKLMLTDNELRDMAVRTDIKRDILNGDIDDAVRKLNELNPAILDRDEKLHFSLLQLQLIEMIRVSDLDNGEHIKRAITFANRNLATRTMNNREFIFELEKVMALVVYGNKPLPEEVASLLQPDCRRKIAVDVNHAILKSQNAPHVARIADMLKVRQWAELKARERKLDIPSVLRLGIEGGDARDEDIEMAELET